MAHVNEVAFNYRPVLRAGEWSVRGTVRRGQNPDGTWKRAQVWLNIPAKLVTPELREMFRSIPSHEDRAEDANGNLIPTGTFVFKGEFLVTTKAENAVFRTKNGIGSSINLIPKPDSTIELERPNSKPVSDEDALAALDLSAEISNQAANRLGRKLGNRTSSVQRIAVEEAAKELGLTGKFGKLVLS